jgi:signal transduction histidine kinase
VTDRRRLERQLLEISAREERRIGQDLHDQLGQLLTGIGFKAELLNRDLQESGSTAADIAGAVVEMVADAVSQTRQLASGLCPVRLDADGLMSALQDLASQTSDVYGIECCFVCEEPVLVDDNGAAMHLYRIAQEAVNNAVKHGAPSKVEIRLASEDEEITLGIRDNGHGFLLPLHEGEGLGLSIMQYRARMLDGSLTLANAPEGGAQVLCQVRNARTGGTA